MVQALDAARRLLPFALLGLDTDNGSEFLNQELLSYCEREQITFNRGRAYKKNDQCYVEQWKRQSCTGPPTATLTPWAQSTSEQYLPISLRVL